MSDEVSPRRLLIVDDEPVILDLLSSLFEDDDLEVLTFATGAEALAAMEADGVDVLLTDKNLPDVGGLDLIRHARRINDTAETLIITGYASLDTALAAMDAGAFDYIVKPPRNIFDVRRKVLQAFEKQAVVRENRRLVEHLQTKNTELGDALEDLRRVQSELIQSEKLAGIGTLAAGIAHEISSPLFGVMGLAEAIQDEDDGSLVREYAGDIVEYCRTIKDIVVELTGYSRAASNEYLTTVDLAQTIADAVRLVERSVPTEGVEIDVDVPMGIYIQARTNEVQQVFVNLTRNAVEAVVERWEAPSQGRVRLTALQMGNAVEISVSDNGIGIDEAKLPMIFDPFYTTKPPGRGTGLGLNIVYRIVTKYRGTVTAESASGEGTTFRLRFPVDEE